MISCGEASGDLYAGALVRELRDLDGSLRVTGFGGARLGASGARLIGDYRGLSVTGLVEVLKLLPRTWRMYRRMIAAAEADRPDVFVAVDFPDFNFRLGQALKARGIPVVYYVGPQLWAWRSGRIQTMKQFVRRVLVIFPFEPPLYEGAGIAVDFVGHPLVDLLEPAPSRAAFLSRLGLDPTRTTVALLPGSRHNEVRLILPVLLKASALMANAHEPLQFVVARAPRLDDDAFGEVNDWRGRGMPVAVIEGETDGVLASADVVVTASGTATVQTALHGRPMVIVYRLSPITYRIGLPFVRVDTYGMVNLVAGRRIVPELIQDACTPEAIARETLRYLEDSAYASATRASLADVSRRLGGHGASRRAAEVVLKIIDSAGVR
jgi:lipid-A-disaccharide synthase